MAVRRKKKKPVRSVKRKIRIRPILPNVGEPTETEMFLIQTESRPL